MVRLLLLRVDFLWRKGWIVMCAACGVLNGGADWLERAGNPDGIGTDDGVTKTGERANLVRMVNILLSPGRTKLRDFYTKLTIQGPTGQSKVVDDLAHVWMAADTIGMCPVDPLDEDYLEAIQQWKE